ncbi:hypothetical protein GALMADRAFT_133555 [Galerina marginata CBS 339.88]|uniref:Uncharacterized protein n=1 Tax=Galerina marginata (strain CBS 339.88) TaxID=685588 RepID=A0A067TYR5_GALM3|nr:hypothetical protein GALMADRAFT_133555 [Galerina marginata CBS 339.88]
MVSLNNSTAASLNGEASANLPVADLLQVVSLIAGPNYIIPKVAYEKLEAFHRRHVEAVNAEVLLKEKRAKVEMCLIDFLSEPGIEVETAYNIVLTIDPGLRGNGTLTYFKNHHIQTAAALEEPAPTQEDALLDNLLASPVLVPGPESAPALAVVPALASLSTPALGGPAPAAAPPPTSAPTSAVVPAPAVLSTPTLGAPTAAPASVAAPLSASMPAPALMPALVVLPAPMALATPATGAATILGHVDPTLDNDQFITPIPPYLGAGDIIFTPNNPVETPPGTRWYSLIVAKQVGVMAHWSVVGPLVSGAANVVFIRHANRGQAVTAFIAALKTGRVHVA